MKHSSRFGLYAWLSVAVALLMVVADPVAPAGAEPLPNEPFTMGAIPEEIPQAIDAVVPPPPFPG